MRQFYIFSITLLLSLLCYSNDSYATHAMGGEITYTCIGPNSVGNNQYLVRATFYYDCASTNPFPTNISLNYTSTCQSTSGTVTLARNPCPVVNGIQTCEITNYCGAAGVTSNCGSGSFPGIREYVYEGVLTLPHHCTEWRISYNVCCRNSAITNLQSPGSQDIFIYATINNANGLCNSSPFFTSTPVPIACTNVPFNYNHGATDPDGDSLVYSIIQSHNTFTNLIPFVGGFSTTYPLATTTGLFGFDPLSGQISFTPSGQQFAVITVLVSEYRNGVLIGTTMRDLQLVIVNNPALCGSNTPPDLEPADSISGGGVIGPRKFQVCPNTTISFFIPTTDLENDTLIMTSNVSLAIPSATFNVFHNNTPHPIGFFSWTPTIADSLSNYFTITITDEGCPLSMSQTYDFEIYVFNKVTIAGPDTIVYCGDSIELSVMGGSQFTWTPTTGLSNPNIANPKAAPTVPTKYIVTSDCGTDSVFVDVQPPFLVDAGLTDTICLHGQTQLNATASPPSQGPYTWLWSPGANLSDSTAPNPIASPTSTTNYILTATSSVGCIKQDTVTLVVQGVAPQVTALISPDTVCPGELVQLDVTTKPGSCGISQLNCNTAPVAYTIGTGSISTSVATLYKGWYMKSRVQYLYRASELTAMGFTGGRIQELAFEVATKASTQGYQGFTIRMGCTNLASLPSTYVTGLTTVFTPKTYNTISGWNNHVLDFPYDWDGTSNLIIEVCFTNTSWTADDLVRTTPTSFNSVLYRNADSSPADPGCSLTSPLSPTTMNRPNMRIRACQQTLTGATVVWSSPLGTITSPQSVASSAHSQQSTTFSVDVNDGNGCIGSSFVNLVIDNTLAIDAGPDISICTPGQIPLNVVANGNPAPITLVCGANNTACPSPQVKTFGTGSTPTAQPSPYSGNTKNRIQYIYRASELQAQGFTTGVISSLAFNVTTKNSSSAFRNLTIKMGCTNTTAFSGAYISGLTTVFSAPTYITTTGWNTHTLNTTYDWNGTSNIVIEVTYDNAGSVNSGGGLSDFIASTTTPYFSVLYTDDPWHFGLDSTIVYDPGLSTQNGNRPNIRLSMCEPPPGNFIVNWTPATGLSATDILDPIATVSGPISYIVTVQDQSGCNATDTVNISFSSTFTLNIGAEHIGCSGNPFGTAWVELAGVSLPYTIEWSTSETTDTITNLAPGTYSVTVEDATGCLGISSVTITTSSLVSIDSIIATDATCAGAEDGTATVYITTGTAPYSYQWSAPGTGPSITDLAPGVYYVTVTDAGQCVAIDSVIVGGQSALVLTTTSVDATCAGIDDGSATVSVAGGTPTYSYIWSNGDVTPTATGLSVGTHTVIVSDANNCTDTATVVIGAPASITFTVSSTDVSCFGLSDGTAIITASGGTFPYTYLWNPTLDTTDSVSGLNAGQYNFLITDAQGCSVNGSVTISAPDSIYILLSSSNESFAGAANGSAWIDSLSGGAGGFTWEWSNNSINTDTISNLTSGVYTVTVTDANGCIDTSSVEVTEPLPLTVVPDAQNVTCAGTSTGGVAVIVSGGTSPYSYQWNTPDSDTTSAVTGLPAGVYTVTVTDAGGGADTVSITIGEPDPLALTGTATDALCFNTATGTVSVSASGGSSPFSYNWSGGLSALPIHNAVAAGTYTVTVTDANNCADSLTLTVGEPAAIVDSVITTPASCGGYNDGSATVSVTSGGNPPFTILWSTNQNTFTVTDFTAGTYTYVITDSTGCTTSGSVTVSEPDPVISTLSKTDITCTGAANGTITVSSTTGGQSPYTYLWSTGDSSASVTNLSSGMYTVTTTDALGCTSTASQTVNEPLELQVTTTVTPISCNATSNGSIKANVSGGTSPFTYLWSNSATTQTASNLLQGVYSVTVTDANGCTATASDSIPEPTPVSVIITVSDEVCPEASDGAVYAQASGGIAPYTYQLYGGTSNTTGIFTGIPGGWKGPILVTDSQGCTYEEQVSVGRADALIVEFANPVETVNLGDAATLTPIITYTGSIAQYIWEPPTGLDCIDCLNPAASPYNDIQYELTIIDDRGCSASANVSVEVINPMYLFVPNAFTPNGDDVNDEFRVFGSAISSVEMAIYNRWGEKVFESSNMNRGWDGTYRGEIAPSGVYLYTVDVIYIDGRRVNRTGSISLIR